MGERNNDDETLLFTPPALAIDWEAYASLLEESDLTDDQKREFIETLWGIVVSFVDMGFGIHPVQQALDQSSGSNDEMTALTGAEMVSSNHTKQE